MITQQSVDEILQQVGDEIMENEAILEDAHDMLHENAIEFYPGTDELLHGSSSSPSSRAHSMPSESQRKNDHCEKHLVYISNIPYGVHSVELKGLIREIVGDVSFVEILEKNGKSKGCAIAEFKDREGAKKCFENMHHMLLRGRFVVVEQITDPKIFLAKVKNETGIDFLRNKTKSLSLAGNGLPNLNNLFPVPQDINFETYGLSSWILKQLNIDGPLYNRVLVKYSPKNVTSAKLKEVFQLAGQVKYVDVQLDKNGKAKGSAIVDYSHPVEAVQAISMLNNQKFMDRVMKVKMDFPEKVREKKIPGELPIGLKSVGKKLDFNGNSSTNGLGNSSGWKNVLIPAILKNLNINVPLCERVFVTYSPINVSSLQLKEVFQLAGHVTDVELQLNNDGFAKGFAVIEYSQSIAAVQAVAMLNNREFMGRPMRVKMDRMEKFQPKRSGDLPIGLKKVGEGLGINGTPLTNINGNGLLKPFTGNSSNSGSNNSTLDCRVLSATNCSNFSLESRFSTQMDYRLP